MSLAYYSTTHPTSLAVALDASSTTIQVLDGSSFPDPALTGEQYTVLVGYGSEREEVCTVTGKPTTTTLTVLRGQDGTPAIAKNAGDTLVHGVSAREFNLINAKLDRAGGAMTGPLVLAGDPAAPLQAATQQYVDARAAIVTAIRRVILNVTADTTAGAAPLTDYVYVCSGSNPIIITMPTAQDNTNRYTIKRATTGATVTIRPFTGEWFDGAVGGSLLLETGWQSVDLVSTGKPSGSKWVIL